MKDPEIFQSYLFATLPGEHTVPRYQSTAHRENTLGNTDVKVVIKMGIRTKTRRTNTPGQIQPGQIPAGQIPPGQITPRTYIHHPKKGIKYRKIKVHLFKKCILYLYTYYIHITYILYTYYIHFINILHSKYYL